MSLFHLSWRVENVPHEGACVLVLCRRVAYITAVELAADRVRVLDCAPVRLM
jgi:hypothetical protein